MLVSSVEKELLTVGWAANPRWIKTNAFVIRKRIAKAIEVIQTEIELRRSEIFIATDVRKATSSVGAAYSGVLRMISAAFQLKCSSYDG